MKVRKAVAGQLAPSVAYLFTCLLGELPQFPLFIRVVVTYACDNYSQISLLPCVSKVFKVFDNKQLLKFAHTVGNFRSILGKLSKCRAGPGTKFIKNKMAANSEEVVLQSIISALKGEKHEFFRLTNNTHTLSDISKT